MVHCWPHFTCRPRLQRSGGSDPTVQKGQTWRSASGAFNVSTEGCGRGRGQSSMTTTQRYTVIATGLGLFMVFLDAIIVNVGLPAIQADFRIGESGLQGVVTAYSLGVVAVIMSVLLRLPIATGSDHRRRESPRLCRGDRTGWPDRPCRSGDACRDPGRCRQELPARNPGCPGYRGRAVGRRLQRGDLVVSRW